MTTAAMTTKKTTKAAKKTAKKSQPRRSLARFIKALGACKVPDVVIGRKPQAAWAAADSDQRRWVRMKLCVRTPDGPCWCVGESATGTRKVFAAYRSFARTGKLPTLAVK